MIINLDVPWNPAVLEQRIGRVHRLGQKRNVSVINMVSAGTIEHRMLDVLKLKSSMAAGILDGGEDAIFMGESRFKKFMSTVGELMNREAGAVNRAPEVVTRDQEVLTPEPEKLLHTPGVPDGLAAAGELVAKGMDFLSTLAAALSHPDSVKQLTESLVAEDPASGKSYLRIPVVKP